jgi:hypothetical protein
MLQAFGLLCLMVIAGAFIFPGERREQASKQAVGRPA